VGVGDVCLDGESSKRREDIWSGDEVIEGVVEKSVGAWSTSSVPTVRVGTSVVARRCPLSIAVGSGGSRWL
jgi:hypothetical protein